MKYRHIGILSAMPEEIGTILEDLQDIKKVNFGDLNIYSGKWVNKNNQYIYLSIAFSGWGKVSAARATTRLIGNNYKNIPVEFILFTGVAGSAQNDINQWDIVLGKCLIQHDMDATPLFDKLVIPPLKQKELIPNENILEHLFKRLTNNDLISKYSKYGKVKKGIIASGDQFVSDQESFMKILSNIPNLSAIEMEGAAFAQVSIQEELPWLVIRVISDNANEGSEEEFSEFVKTYKKCSHQLITVLVESFI